MTERITIVGGGNLGLACAARLAEAGVEVTLLTTSPGSWSSEISVEDCDGRVFAGRLARVTSDPAVAADADLIFLCLPGNVIKERLLALKPYLVACPSSRVPVASVFSADGFFFLAEEVLGTDWPVMGFARVPFISRTKVPFRVGGITGYRKELQLAQRNLTDPESWRRLFARAFGTPTCLLDNFYVAALANSNPIIHPARLMSLRRQIEANGPFSRMPLFYEEWDDVASDYAIRLDAELRAVASAMGARLVPFLEYYESSDAPSLTRKIRSIAAFKGIGSPVLKSGEIDFSSRHVQADIVISVGEIRRLSRQLGLVSPCADEICALDWRQEGSGCR